LIVIGSKIIDFSRDTNDLRGEPQDDSGPALAKDELKNPET
jgi:hypothetical protein